jgi:effector-binding domain-containing protein
MHDEPKLEQRDARRYVGIRTRAAVRDLPTVIPQLNDEIAAWLSEQGLAPSGPPLIRYYTTDMETQLDIEIGWELAQAVAGTGRIEPRTLPAGRYAVVVHQGPYDQLVGATAALLAWAEQQGIAWQMDGDEWASRVESYLTDPMEVPDPAQWRTELAFLTA